LTLNTGDFLAIFSGLALSRITFHQFFLSERNYVSPFCSFPVFFNLFLAGIVPSVSFLAPVMLRA